VPQVGRRRRRGRGRVMHDDDLLTLDQAAPLLSCSKEQVAKLTKKGELPYVNIGAGAKREARRVKRGEVRAFIERRSHARDAVLVRHVNAAARQAKVPERY
jgi:excisionase family DNA binding protein